MTKWKLVPAEQFYELMFSLAELERNGALPYQLEGMAAAIEAAPTPPKSEPIAYIEHHKGGDNLVWDNPGGKYSVLYSAPPAPSVPDGWRPFLTDVITAAGLLQHGKRDKGLAGRIGKFAFDAMPAAPTPAEPPADVVRDAEPWKLLLENLVEGLNKTHWSSWQGTAHFDEYLQEAISAIERDKLKGQS